MKVTNELVIEVKKSLLERLVPRIILASKNEIVSYKYSIDTTDTTDNNNIKLARSVSDNVYNMLPEVVQEVTTELQTRLGETNNAGL